MIIERYLEVVRDGFIQILSQGAAYGLPLSILLGVVFVMGVVAWAFGRREWTFEVAPVLRMVGGGVALVLALWIGTSALRATRFLTQRDLRMQSNAQATANPVSDAPPVAQTGPAVAVLSERTYNSMLTLPPSFLGRLGAEGLNVLAPYLSNPSAGNVVRLKNSFKKSGRTAVFSRQVTVLEEKPLSFLDSNLKVSFARLSGRAFECAFEARYAWKNSSTKPRLVHFLFSLPEAGTVRDLQVRVGKQNLGNASDSQTGANADSDAGADAGAENAAPSDSDTYEWKQIMLPGETREAKVSYRVTGARTWNYDLGSARRRVEAFSLDADTDGDIRFARGSLQPSSVRGNRLGWQLASVVTAQSLALVFPSDHERDQLYIQALTALPLCLLLLTGCVLALGIGTGRAPSPLQLAAATAIFAVGLGGASIQTPLTPLVFLLAGPLSGAIAACAVLGRRFILVAVPVALLPATFLSPHHTGLLVLSLFCSACVAIALWRKRALSQT